MKPEETEEQPSTDIETTEAGQGEQTAQTNEPQPEETEEQSSVDVETAESGQDEQAARTDKPQPRRRRRPIRSEGG